MSSETQKPTQPAQARSWIDRLKLVTNNQRLVRNIAQRYMLVLIFLALVGATDYIMVNTQIDISKNISSVLTLAGRQRSLTANAATLAENLMQSNDEERNRIRTEMMVTSEQLLQTEQDLESGIPGVKDSGHQITPEMRSALYSPPHMFHSRLNQFAAQVQALANTPDKDLNAVNVHYQAIRTIIHQGGLFDALDTVVNLHQKEAEAKLEGLRLLNTINFVLFLGILTALGWFVFKPMNDSVKQYIEELTNSQNEAEREVEARRMLEQSLRNAQDRKQKTMAMIAHDLRTPIKGEQRVLQQFKKGAFGGLTLEQEEVIGELIHSNRFLDQMLDNLLSNQKYEDGQMKLSLELVNINSFIQTIVGSELGALADEKQQSLVMDFDSSAPEVYLDSIEMRRVIVNLVANAIKFSPNNSVITLTTRRGPDSVRVSIGDQGPGIPPDQMDSLFEPYHSLAKKYKLVGTGLGLYLCKQVIEAHEGEIGVDSQLNEGSTFYFVLPLA